MISAILATTGRPDEAERCIRELRATTEGHELEIVCGVDADPVTARRVVPLVDVLDVAPHYRGSGQAWNDCLRRATGDPIVLAADDLHWQEGWLDWALLALEDFDGGWGMVGFNDGHSKRHEADGRGRDFATHYLLSRRFIAEVLGGVVAWPCYGHSLMDRETNARARRANRFIWCEDAKVFHRHWLFGDRAKDETDRRHLGLHPAATAAYRKRQAHGFPNDYDPVL